MIIALTGQPRHGKSMYAVMLIKKYIDENKNLIEKGDLPRNIYTDIKGINDKDVVPLDGVQKFDKNKSYWFGEDDEIPEGYYMPPKSSVFIIDECHKIDWIRDKSGALSNNPTTISLNEHGHNDYIIILMTQFPKYIHTHIHGLVEYHYHVKRFHGAFFANVYKWNEFQVNPRSKTAIDDSPEKERFKYRKKYYQHYKSASSHESMKFRMPPKFFYFVAALVVIFGFSFYRTINSSGTLNKVVTGSSSETKSSDNSVQANNLPKLDDSTKRRINDLQAEIEYLKQKYLPKHINTLSISEDIRPAMVISTKTSCRSYNTFGELLNLPFEICMFMSNKPALIPRSRVEYPPMIIEGSSLSNGTSNASSSSSQPDISSGSNINFNPF